MTLYLVVCVAFLVLDIDVTQSLLNLAQVATRLGVSRTTAWRLVSSGSIPSVRITDTIRRVAVEDLEAWVASRREHSPADVVELDDARLRRESP